MAHPVRSDEQLAEELLDQARKLDARADALRTQARDLASEAGRLRAEAANVTREPIGITTKRDDLTKRRIVRMLADWGRCSVPQIAEHLNVSDARVRSCMTNLEQAGEAKRVGVGSGTLWAIASDEGDAVRQGSSARTMIRDAARTLDVFTFSELSAEVAVLSDVTLRRWLPQLVAEGVLQEERDGKRKLYAYATPHRTGETHTPARPRQAPPEAKVIEHARRSRPVTGTGRGRRAGGALVNELLRELRAVGGVEIRQSAHAYLFAVDDTVIASCSRTPGASSLKETRAHLIRAGIPVRPG